jgi:hypothetical protein
MLAMAGNNTSTIFTEGYKRELELTSLMSIAGTVSSSYSDSSSELDSSSEELVSVGVEGDLFGDLTEPSSRRLLNLFAVLGP